MTRIKNFVCILLLFGFTGCNTQVEEKENNQKVNKKEQEISKPKVTWDVKKTYDALGNLKQYDSIYSYSYSSSKGDSITVNLDSIMNIFRGYFEENTTFNKRDQLFYFPKSDSLFVTEFFKDDYFFSQWQQHPIDIEQLLLQMDSVRNRFLKQFHPGLIESKSQTKLKSL